MPAFILASYDIVDPVAYQAYLLGVIPLLQKHGAEVLVADPEGQALEGGSNRHHIVLKFESEEAAKAWYDDPEYQPVKKIRFAATENSSLVLTTQWAPPID